MSEIERCKGECTALSYLVTYASRARNVMRRAMVNESMFTSDERRTAFVGLMDAATDDEALLLGVALKAVPALNATTATDEFLGLSANPGALEYETIQFVRETIAREAADEMRLAMQMCDGRHLEMVAERQQRIAAETQAKLAALDSQFPIAPPAANAADANAPFLLDESLLHVPGFVDEVVEYSMRAAPRPNRVLAFAGALTMLAHLAGRKFIGPNDARPNIYVIALADSGVGKEFPRSLNRNLAQLQNLEMSVKNLIGSGQGLEDALRRTPALLMQMDEFDTTMNVLKDERGNRQATESTWDMLLSVFSESNSNHAMRTKAASQQNRDGDGAIYAPSLSLFATAIPSKFYGSLCERALDNGLLARTLVFQAGRRSKRNLSSGMNRNEIPLSIRWKVQCLANMRRCNDNSPIDRRDLTDVPFAAGAEAEVEKIDAEAERLYDIADRKDDSMERSVWNRSVELCMKLALLYAISEGIGVSDSFSISRDAVAWAWKVVKPLQLQMLEMVRENTADTKFDEHVKKTLRHIRKAGKKGILRGDLSRKMRLSPRELDEIEDALLEREEITMTELPRSGNGKAAKLYIAMKKDK